MNAAKSDRATEARNRADAVIRRLRWKDGRTEQELAASLGWPVGTGAALRELAREGHAHQREDGRWYLGAVPVGAAPAHISDETLEERVLLVLAEGGPLRVADIAARSGGLVARVQAVLQRLRKQGIVQSAGAARSTTWSISAPAEVPRTGDDRPVVDDAAPPPALSSQPPAPVEEVAPLRIVDEPLRLDEDDGDCDDETQEVPSPLDRMNAAADAALGGSDGVRAAIGGGKVYADLPETLREVFRQGVTLREVFRQGVTTIEPPLGGRSFPRDAPVHDALDRLAAAVGALRGSLWGRSTDRTASLVERIDAILGDVEHLSIVGVTALAGIREALVSAMGVCRAVELGADLGTHLDAIRDDIDDLGVRYRDERYARGEENVERDKRAHAADGPVDTWLLGLRPEVVRQLSDHDINALRAAWSGE